MAAAEDMTQRKPNPWFVRGTSTSSQCAHPMADYCAKTLKYKRMAVIADDIAYGHEMCAGFQRVFEDAGGKIVQKLFPPLTVPDYGTLPRAAEDQHRRRSSSASPARTAFATCASSTSTA